MDNGNYATEKIQPSAAESAEKSKVLTEACLVMKAEIKDEALEIFAGHRDHISKPKTLTEACAVMKAEIKDEAKRLVPDLGNQH